MLLLVQETIKNHPRNRGGGFVAKTNLQTDCDLASILVQVGSKVEVTEGEQEWEKQNGSKGKKKGT